MSKMSDRIEEILKRYEPILMRTSNRLTRESARRHLIRELVNLWQEREEEVRKESIIEALMAIGDGEDEKRYGPEEE